MSNRPLTGNRTRATGSLIATRVIFLALGILLIVVLFLLAGYTVFAEYTGFHKKELWDWLGLGGVSAAIALVGWLFSRRQREQQEAVTREHEQDAALAAYLDQMSNLMIDQELGKDQENNRQEEVRKVAQARTIAILLELDKEHKRRPLKLVYELGLLNTPDPVLELRNVGLDGANLSELTLRNACLRGADLSGADLTDANLLPYDEKNPTTWNKHNLEKRSTLNNGASFYRKRLGLKVRKEVKVRKGLKVTDLSGATLREAQFSNAWLHGVNLSGADLKDAKGITTEELVQQAFSIKGATMPDGQKYEDWLKSEGHGKVGENSGPS